MFPNELLARLLNVFESFTKAFKVISTDHAYIHDGKSFRYPHLLSITAGGTNKITFLTPTVLSGKVVHFRPADLSTSGDKVTVNMYETSTGNTGGNARVPLNSNRNSALASGSTLLDGVTVTGNGTLIDIKYIGGGTGVGQARSGAGSQESEEIVLKPATLYTIEVINNSSATNIVLIGLRWYEE